MTKGKRATATANRALAQEEALAPYKRKVASLTRELTELRRTTAEQVDALRRELRRAKAERNEGISPALTVAQREAVRLREERDAALARRDEVQRKTDRVLRGVVAHFVAAHAMTTEQALQELLRMESPDDRGVVVPDDSHNPGMASLSTEGRDAVMRARKRM